MGYFSELHAERRYEQEETRDFFNVELLNERIHSLEDLLENAGVCWNKEKPEKLYERFEKKIFSEAEWNRLATVLPEDIGSDRANMFYGFDEGETTNHTNRSAYITDLVTAIAIADRMRSELILENLLDLQNPTRERIPGQIEFEIAGDEVTVPDWEEAA